MHFNKYIIFNVIDQEENPIFNRFIEIQTEKINSFKPSLIKELYYFDFDI